MRSSISKYLQIFLVFILVGLVTLSCSRKIRYFPSHLHTHISTLMESVNTGDVLIDPIQICLEDEPLEFYLPALQSAAMANYKGTVILIGGRKSGLHSMNDYPVAFNRTQANDSIWVIDLAEGKSMGVPNPPDFKRFLSATNQQYYQVGDILYTGGGFTLRDSTSQFNDWTSDRLFEINLPNLIQYVSSQGLSPSLDQVFTKVLQNSFLQVTGGEMMVVNNQFYLIGGQNYIGRYIPGNEGIYTNAIRKFKISPSDDQWTVSDTLSIIDPENLHRRDFNLAEVMRDEVDSIGAVIYGGVFTEDEMAYRSPVYISGLVSGNPIIKVDTVMLQKVNLYTSAKIEAILPSKKSAINHVSFLGGISYMKYDPKLDSLIIPEGIYKLPFSNLISSYFTNGKDGSYEMIQLPPLEMMPGYLGSNANFIGLSQYLYPGSSNILDLDKVFPNLDQERVHVGYMFGGIQSPEATTVTPRAPIPTRVNPKLYKVFMEVKKQE